MPSKACLRPRPRLRPAGCAARAVSSRILAAAAPGPGRVGWAQGRDSAFGVCRERPCGKMLQRAFLRRVPRRLLCSSSATTVSPKADAPQPNPNSDTWIKVGGLVTSTAIVMFGAVKIADKAADIAESAGQRAEKIADKAAESAKEIALLSKAGSTEEAAALKKTEKMAHAAALGSANGATDALKSRWWILWPW